MNGRAVYHLMRADFLQRVRSYAFLGMLLFTIFVTYLFIPAPESIQVAGLQLGGYRSQYSSAWIGSMTVLLMGEFFLLFAFYFLRGSTERDRRTGVGQIIAATPLIRPVYVLGKWLSNVAVIGFMVAIIIAAAVVLQFIRAEVPLLDLWALAAPFIFVLLPALIVIAAAAVFFDCVNWLRGAVGNILFFFIAYPLLTLTLDLSGSSIIYPSIYRACAAQFSGCNPTRQIDAGMPPLLGLPVFHYDGVPWTVTVILGRLGLVLAGVLIALLAARFFNRFDPAREGFRLPALFTRRARPASSTAGPVGNVDNLPQPLSTPAGLTPIPGIALTGPSIYARLLRAELHLIFKGVHWLWFLVALVIIAAVWVLPLDAAHLYVLPLAWIWPLALWSGLGTRETRFRTGQIIFSTPYSLQRQLPVTFLAGALIALIMASGLFVRFLLAGQWLVLLSLLVGVAFVPALALALGIWSGAGKLFEGAYLFLWYLTSVAGVQVLDYMGRYPGSFTSGRVWLYAGLALLFSGIAFLGRRRQVQG